MPTFINGRKLTKSEVRVLDAIRDYLAKHSGDTGMQPGYSPMGNGRWVPLLEIFPRGNAGTADRHTAQRLAVLGILHVCEVAYFGDNVKAVPSERVKAEEAAARSPLT